MNWNSRSLKNWRVTNQHVITQSVLNADLTARSKIPN